MNAGERSVIFNKFRGVKDVPAGEGLRYIIPFVEKPIIYDIKTRPRSISTITGTKGILNFLKICASFIFFVIYFYEYFESLYST